MAKVKFVNAVKYRGVRYPAHTPFTVDDADIESLVSKGAIIIEPPASAEDSNEPIPSNNSEKDFDRMKIDELKAYAAENNIDISGLEKKAEILNAIKASEIPDK